MMRRVAVLGGLVLLCGWLLLGGCGDSSTSPNENERSAGGARPAASAGDAQERLAAARQDNPLFPAEMNEPAQGVIRFGAKAPKPRTPGAFRLATYNVENLFDAHDDPAVSDDPNTPRSEDDIDVVKPAEQLEQIAEAIRRLDADVLALQEIESFDALVEFRDNYLSGLGYEHVVSLDSGDRRGIENAVLSRYPLSDAEVWPDLPLGGVHPANWGSGENWHAGEPIEFRRSPLRVTVTVPGGEGGAAYTCTLYIVHHKSGRHGGYWREREAAKLAEFIAAQLREDPDANIAVLGDFNCQWGDAPFEAYVGAGMARAYTPDPDLPEWKTHSSGREIDSVLVSPGMARDVVAESAFVLGTPIRPEGLDWRTTPDPIGYAADHFPVSVDVLRADR